MNLQKTACDLMVDSVNLNEKNFLVASGIGLARGKRESVGKLC
jgi:hypothetical protein